MCLPLTLLRVIKAEYMILAKDDTRACLEHSWLHHFSAIDVTHGFGLGVDQDHTLLVLCGDEQRKV